MKGRRSFAARNVGHAVGALSADSALSATDSASLDSAG